MKLDKLLKNVELLKIDGPTTTDVTQIANDSRNVKRNSLFIAIKGMNFDGHNYILNAIKKGALVVVVEENLTLNLKNKNITIVTVKNSRKALAIIAANFYKNPASKMKLVGITGTNGKTTTSELAYQLLKALGKNVGLISTIMVKFNDREFDTGYHVTSPEPLDLHKYLSWMQKEKCEYAIIETTSHALDQYRMHGLTFEVAAVTNITPEHLDYHKTMDNYIKVKARIFAQSKKLFLNKYDPSLKSLKKLSGKNTVIVDCKKLVIPKYFSEIFPGQYNLENIALASTIVTELTKKRVEKVFNTLKPVVGRMEYIIKGGIFDIVIDFAHDASSLEKTLKIVRQVTRENLILVFGCAGLRDMKKRPIMGEIAMRLADKVIVTAEDPRTENLKDINASIEKGILKAKGKLNKNYFIVEDRQEAINMAIHKLAKKGDLILITGKGHEKSMCFGTTEHPWSDQEAVRSALKNHSSDNNISTFK